MATKQKKNQKLTTKQKADRLQAAQEQERRAELAKEKAGRSRKVFTIIMGVILILALGLPTTALIVMGGN